MSMLVVQVGHLGRTSGATGAPGEVELVTRIAARIEELAAEVDGWEVRVIPADTDDADYRGDAFIALHADGSSNPKAGGASVGYRTVAGRNLGHAWQRAYVAAGWPHSFRADNYTRALANYYGNNAAIRVGNRRAVIVEHGFITNPVEAHWMRSEQGIEAAARAAWTAVTGRDLAASDPEQAERPTTPPDDWRQAAMARLPTIRQGGKGADVRRAQSLLAAAGHPPANTFRPDGRPDGQFGPGTDTATKAFQRSKSITVDGIIGPETWSKLLGL